MTKKIGDPYDPDKVEPLDMYSDGAFTVIMSDQPTGGVPMLSFDEVHTWTGRGDDYIHKPDPDWLYMGKLSKVHEVMEEVYETIISSNAD